MMECSPQRYLANNRNLVRTAALTPSSVQPVSDSVLELPVARQGTAQVALTGPYSGAEEATYDVEILDNNAEANLISAPVFTGEGSGSLSDISMSGTAQTINIELNNAGVPELYAGVNFEGVRILAKLVGVAGDGITIDIDQSGLTFTPQSFSLLQALDAGDGGLTSGLTGAAFDWDTKVLSANTIPSSAHRVSFGDNESDIYLQYKEYVDAQWQYHFVPAIKRAIPQGTRVNFVTGGRTITVAPPSGPGTEVYVGIVTAYDILNALKTTSSLVTVSGVVANDRSPTGQASRELAARTDAHAEQSHGTGSSFAILGFTDVTVEDAAATELVTATCFAVTSKDHPLARLGRERWELRGSVSGNLGDIVTGIPYIGTSFGLTIPERLPGGYGTPRGRFTVTDIQYVPRDADAKPPICVVAMTLGTEAVDQTVTLKYTRRPSGDCVCASMPVPRLSRFCLGLLTGEGTQGMYTAATITKLVAMYDWYATLVRDASSYHADGSGIMKHFLIEPNEDLADGFTVESLQTIIQRFEEVIAELDVLEAGSPDYMGAGMTAWDTAFAELMADVDALIAGEVGGQTYVGEAAEALSADDAVVWYYDGALEKNMVRKAVELGGAGRYGFVKAGFSSAADATVYTSGVVGGQAGLTVGDTLKPKKSVPGDWDSTGTDGLVGDTGGGQAVSTSEFYFNGDVLGGLGISELLLSERYSARLNWVLMSGGISPAGKSDADTLTSGDGCWRDYGDAYYWSVVGSDKGAYAPAFTNHPYYSSRAAVNANKYYSTKEFGFQVNVKCPQLLVEDDEIILSIGDAGWGATYQIGDTMVLPIIAGQPLTLAGGQDADDTLTWYVSGSVDGPFANFDYVGPGPDTYTNGGLAFTYTPGGIPNVAGDAFTFTVEGGHYRWRKNGGSWTTGSPLPVINTVAQAFDSGLLIAFTPGAYPSFVPGDTYSFRALQPWAVSNVQNPNNARWQWDELDPDLVMDFGSPQPISGVAIALHTLPAGTGLIIEGGNSPGVYTWSETLTYQPGAIVKEFTEQTSQYARLRLNGSTPVAGGVGFLWLGTPLTTTLSADVQLKRSYKVQKGRTGLNGSGKFMASAMSGEVSWQEGAMTDADVAGIAALLDWSKQNDDEPFVFVPQTTRPEEAFMESIVVDEVTFEELSAYNANADRERRYNISLPLAGVWE